MVSVLFDNIKTALKVKFESDIRLKNKNELVVLLTDKGKGTGKYVEVLIKQVRSWRQELTIDLDFKSTEEFKDKEVNIDDEKMMILTKSMLEDY